MINIPTDDSDAALLGRFINARIEDRRAVLEEALCELAERLLQDEIYQAAGHEREEQADSIGKVIFDTAVLVSYVTALERFAELANKNGALLQDSAARVRSYVTENSLADALEVVRRKFDSGSL